MRLLIILLKMHNIFYYAADPQLRLNSSAAPEGRIFTMYTEKQWNLQKIQRSVNVHGIVSGKPPLTRIMFFF